MLSSDGDFICWSLHNRHVLPLLFMEDQSSLNQHVIQEDIDDDVVAGVDFGTYIPAATYDVLGVQRKPSVAAQAL